MDNNQLIELQAKVAKLMEGVTDGPWYPNGQEFDCKVMLQNGMFIGEFDSFADCRFAAEARTIIPMLAKLIEDNTRLAELKAGDKPK